MEKTDTKQRRKPKQARAIAKYNAILDASARVLDQVGFRNATMSEISLESGQPYATIYQYFGCKEDIYLAWLERFMEDSFFELATLVRNSPGANLDQHIEVSARYALQQIAHNRQTLGKLINGMSLISSQLVIVMEEKSMEWIRKAYGDHLEQIQHSRLLDNMLTAARAGNGYWLMLVLNTKREIDIPAETRNIAALMKALLFNP